jgi:excisionase family DNA binding protein
MDPDQRVREAVSLAFRKFAELGSIRQVHLWFRHEGVELPAVAPNQSPGVVWKLPVYHSVHHILTNPIYAGAYAFGRTSSRTRLENGRKRVVHGIRRERDEWEVLIRDHHDGYLTWAEYERNQKVIADNANCQGAAARGSIRQGEALLAGLVRCGHCGRNLHVTYPGDQRSMARYACRGGHVNHGTELCISFGGLRVDRAVGEAVLHVLRPLGIEAALKAIEERRRASCEVLRQAELALEAARFEEQHARRQYDAVDPDNRLVASELERRWNERLEVVRQRDETVSALLASREHDELSEEEREKYLALGADLDRVWHHERATPESRKRILRALLVEVVANVEGDRIVLRLHWQGGDHTELTVRKNRTGQHRWTTDVETGDLVRELARLMPDRSIASFLNRVGKRTGKNNPWTEARVRAFRGYHRVAVYREGERQERNELTLQEAAERLRVSKMTVLRQIRRGAIPARQACKGAPWVISVDALEHAQRPEAASEKGPVTAGPRQQTLEI